MSISSIQASKVQKRDFRHFFRAKVFYSNGNVKFENFMHSKWSEEKFLKGIVGGQTRLRFWIKHRKIKLLFIFEQIELQAKLINHFLGSNKSNINQLAHYNKMHVRLLMYIKTINFFANKQNLSRHKVDIWFFLLSIIYSSSAAWAKDLSFDACFRSIASFGDPHYLSRTSPHSI